MATATEPLAVASSAGLALPPWLRRAEPPTLADLVDDFALFAYTVCTVADREGFEVPFIENPMQRRVNEIEDAMRREQGYAWLWQLKMRRGGLSMNTQLRNLWRTWRRPNTRGATLAHERESTDEIFQITRLAVLRAPATLLPPLGRERQRAVSFPGMGSRFFTGTAGADAIGRGSDFSFLHVSEFAFIRKAKQLHTSASQAVRKDGTYILESTASAWGSEPHQMWQEARAGRSKFRAVFFPWWWRDDAYLPLEAPDALGTLDEEERQLLPAIVAHQLELDTWYYRRPPDPAAAKQRALQQLHWRRDKIRELGAEEFDREYPKDDSSCWLAAGTPFFDRRALAWLLAAGVREPLRRDWSDELRIYAEPDPNRRYLLGCDVAEGVNQDRSTLCVLDYESMEQVAAFSSRTIPPEDLADRANALGRLYANARTGPAVQVVERNNMGHTTLYRLAKLLRYPRSRLWHDTKLVEGQRRPVLGWRTGPESKHLALNDGAELLRSAHAEGRAILHDAETLDDLKAVQRGDSGEIELTGKDCAVAWLLAYQGRKHPVAVGMPGADAEADDSGTAALINRRH